MINDLLPEQQILYRLTDSQIMLLWEEAPFFPLIPPPPSNFLYFQMTIPAGDTQSFARAFNKILETSDSLRLRVIRIDAARISDAKEEYNNVKIMAFRRWLRCMRQFVSAYEYYDLPVFEVAGQKEFQVCLENFQNHRQTLLNGPLFAAELVRIGTESVTLVARFHHIVIDGYSFRILFERLSEYYNEFLISSQSFPAIYSIIPYFDSDAKYRSSQRRKNDSAFWKKAFTTQPHYSFPAGYTPLSSSHLTIDRKFEGQQYLDCSALSASIGVGCSNYALLLFIAAFTVYRLTGKTNFALFHMSHGRTDAAGKQTIGTMINMIPLFFNLKKSNTFMQELQNCRIAYLESMMHSRLSFNELINFYFHESIRHGFNFNHAWMVFSSEDFEASVARSPYYARTFGAKNLPHQFFCEILEVPNERIDISLRFQTRKHSSQQVESYLQVFMDTFALVIRQPNDLLSCLDRRN